MWNFTSFIFSFCCPRARLIIPRNVIEKRNRAPSRPPSCYCVAVLHCLRSQQALVGNASRSRRDFYTELIADEEHRWTQVKQGDWWAGPDDLAEWSRDGLSGKLPGKLAGSGALCCSLHSSDKCLIVGVNFALLYYFSTVLLHIAASPSLAPSRLPPSSSWCASGKMINNHKMIWP